MLSPPKRAANFKETVTNLRDGRQRPDHISLQLLLLEIKMERKMGDDEKPSASTGRENVH